MKINIFFQLLSSCLVLIQLSCCFCETKNATANFVHIEKDTASIKEEFVIEEIAKCLPIPSEKFLRQMENDSLNHMLGRPNNGDFKLDIIYIYLIYHLDSLNEKHVLKEDNFWGPIEWTQAFENGVEYKHIDYVEVGSGGELYTTCKSKSDFLNVIAPLIEVDEDLEYQVEYRWKSDSTKYEPKEIDAGCFYKIQMNADSCYFVTWYCGC